MRELFLQVKKSMRSATSARYVFDDIIQAHTFYKWASKNFKYSSWIDNKVYFGNYEEEVNKLITSDLV